MHIPWTLEMWESMICFFCRVNLVLGTTILRKFVLFWKNFILNLDRSPCCRCRGPTGELLPTQLFPQLSLSLTCVPSQTTSTDFPDLSKQLPPGGTGHSTQRGQTVAIIRWWSNTQAVLASELWKNAQLHIAPTTGPIHCTASLSERAVTLH